LLENLAINKKGEYRLGKIGKISDAKQFERKHGLRDYYECERCFIEYSHKGRVMDVGTCEADFRSVDEGVDFCRKYIGIPHPFKALDVVSSFRNGEKRIGLISPLYLRTGNEPEKPQKTYSDDVLTVEWLCDKDKKIFCHDHVNPMHLEFYELMGEDWQKK